MNIATFLEQQKELFLKAKAELEASRLKQPDREFPIRMKEKTVATLRARVTSLANAKEEAVQEFDARITSLKADIARLEKEIKSDSAVLVGPKPTKHSR